MSRSDSKRDYYSILGASEDASQGEIERLYKRGASRHHPDRGGNEEEMKALNEAYGVLKNTDARRAYDAERRKPKERVEDFTPHASPAAQADPVMGRVAGAVLCLFAGLFLLLLVRFQWIWFLWPLALLALMVLFMGVMMAHAAVVAMRETSGRKQTARRSVILQEAAFWSVVCVCGYGLYLVLSEV